MPVSCIAISVPGGKPETSFEMCHFSLPGASFAGDRGPQREEWLPCFRDNRLLGQGFRGLADWKDVP